MYLQVLEVLREEGLNANPQTVSIHVNLGGNDIDVVPARSLSDGSGYANLYVSSKDTSIQTNIPKQRELMAGSKARPVIKLMKVWRHRHSVNFKSFALELLVMKALEAASSNADLGTQFWTALGFARDHAVDTKLVDPANSNNVVSELVPDNDKLNLARQAGASMKSDTWDKILW